MPTWPTSKIREAVIASLEAAGGAVPGNVGDGNTVGDFYPGATALPAPVKGAITKQIKKRCELDDFWWSKKLSTTIGHLIKLVSMFQEL